MDGDAVSVVEMSGDMFRTIDGAVLSAGTTESDLQMGESAFKETLHMMVNEFVHRLQKCEYLAVFFQEIYNRLVETGEMFELFILARVMGGAAVKDIPSSVAGIVRGNAFFEGKRVYGDNKTAAL